MQNNIGMCFGICKCCTLMLKTRENHYVKVLFWKGVTISQADIEGCKYLGIKEKGDVFHNEMFNRKKGIL